MTDRQIIKELAEMNRLDQEIAEIVWESDTMKHWVLDKLAERPDVMDMVESYKINHKETI